MHAGYRRLQVTDPSIDIAFAVVMFYPTAQIARPTQLGPYVIDISPDAAPVAGRGRLVVISHGNNGTPLVYRDLAAHLAKNGYVVALLEHHGNNRNDTHLEFAYENLVYRPRHVRLVIDAVLSHADFKPMLDPSRVAVIGHSFGGYTALAVAGGVPYTLDARKIDTVPDPRVGALVLLTPATVWYVPPGSLSAVRTPILMLTAEHDPFTPSWHADLVRRNVADPRLVTHKIIDNAGHFSFLSPFPPHMRTDTFLPAFDPPGFDRDRFLPLLQQDVQGFLDTRLG